MSKLIYGKFGSNQSLFTVQYPPYPSKVMVNFLMVCTVKFIFESEQCYVNVASHEDKFKNENDEVDALNNVSNTQIFTIYNCIILQGIIAVESELNIGV